MFLLSSIFCSCFLGKPDFSVVRISGKQDKQVHKFLVETTKWKQIVDRCFLFMSIFVVISISFMGYLPFSILSWNCLICNYRNSYSTELQVGRYFWFWLRRVFRSNPIPEFVWGFSHQMHPKRFFSLMYYVLIRNKHFYVAVKHKYIV